MFLCSVIFQKFRGPRFWKYIFPLRDILLFFWGDFGYQFLAKGPEIILETSWKQEKNGQNEENRLVFLNSFLKFRVGGHSTVTTMWGRDTRKSRQGHMFQESLHKWHEGKWRTQYVLNTYCVPGVMPWFFKNITMCSRCYCQFLDKGSNPRKGE